jgi:hypothetical protein
MPNKFVITDPVFIKDANQPVAVILPIALYESLCHKAGVMPAHWATGDHAPGFTADEFIALQQTLETAPSVGGEFIDVSPVIIDDDTPPHPDAIEIVVPEAPAVDVPPTSDFAREQATFERFKPSLKQHYPNRWVALVGDEVVAVGDDEFELAELVNERYGRDVAYIRQVSDASDSPPIYHRTVQR